MAPTDSCLVHLSDLHFLEDPAASQHGVHSAEIFERAIPLINAVGPDLIVAGGDLTSDEKPASYRRARSGFARLHAPVHAIPGNHDDRSVYRSVFHPDGPPSPDPLYRAVDHGPWRLALLDSHLPGEVSGQMDAAQLAWLDADLAFHPERPIFAFVHHPPLPIGVKWLDRLGLLNGQDLLRVVGRHPQVRAVFFGHVHQPRIWRHRGIVFASVPALAFQFSPTEQETTGRHITQDTPGFRVIRSRGGDRFETAIHYLDGRIVPDPPPERLPEYGA